MDAESHPPVAASPATNRSSSPRCTLRRRGGSRAGASARGRRPRDGREVHLL